VNGSIHQLNQFLQEAQSSGVDVEQTALFAAYLELLVRWNTRINLTAVRDEEGIVKRHFVESILCARALPQGITTLLDFGSGAGFPGLPIALCRPEISVTLAESQHKKVAFLREAIRILGIAVEVYSSRAELIRSVFDCVVLRAVDRMEQAVPRAASLLRVNGWLGVMTTTELTEAIQHTASATWGIFDWHPSIPLPPGANRILLIGQKGS
jgi:16S rRNA (guanine527-N7)-methyltransferase